MGELIFGQWVFGNGGSVRRHAVMRMPVAGMPRAMTVRSLCGVSGLGASNKLFDPVSGSHTCVTCARRWTARYAPAIPGWTKRCRCCDSDKPINQFHVDKRTADKMSTRCLDCEEAARAVVRTAERAAQVEADRQDAVTRAHRWRDARLAMLIRWQGEPSLPTYVCGAGHVLTPVAEMRRQSFHGDDTVWPVVEWRCGCGISEVTSDQTHAAAKAAQALDMLSQLRRGETVVAVTTDDVG